MTNPKPKRRKPGPNPLYPTKRVCEKLHLLAILADDVLPVSDSVAGAIWKLARDPELLEWRRRMDERTKRKN